MIQLFPSQDSYIIFFLRKSTFLVLAKKGHVIMNNKKRYIFTKYITVKGVRIYASEYGKKAFRIEVKD